MQAYERLEQEFGEFVQCGNVVACASGTSALHLALEALRLPQGSKVAVPDFTMIACARAVTMAGLTPVFVDCGDDLLINKETLERAKLFYGFDAIMAVHVYGRLCNMEDVYGFGVSVIEDCAECHGADKADPRTFARCYSFYQNKIIAGEEGGAIAFSEPEPADYARCLRSHGFTPSHDFYHVPRGVNARLSNMHAKAILESLAAYWRNVAERLTVWGLIDNELILSGRKTWPLPQAPWVYAMEFPREVTARLVPHLQEQYGVPARFGFKALSTQLEYRRPSPYPGRAIRAGFEACYAPLAVGGRVYTVGEARGIGRAIVRNLDGLSREGP